MDINRFQPFDAVDTELQPGINLIEASAGTGKTFAIAMLVLRFVVEQDLRIEQLLIVTFTKAATEELKERIRARLAGAKRALDGQMEGCDEVLAAWVRNLTVAKTLARQRLQLALLDIDRAGIFTIHGFCQRVLNEHALESGQVFDAELRGDLQKIRQQIADDFWRLHVAAATPRIAALLTHVCKTPDALLQTAKTLADDVPVFPPGGDVGAALAQVMTTIADALAVLPANAAKIRAALPGGYFKSEYGAAFETRVQALQNWLLPGTGDTNKQQNLAMAPQPCPVLPGESASDLLDADQPVVPAHLPQDSSAPALFLRQTLLDGLNGHKFRGNKTQPGEQRKQQYLDALAIDSAPFEALQDALRQLSIAFRCAFISYLRRECENQQQQQNLLSFDTLISRLAAALRGERAEWLLRTLRQRYRAALIDEFQDTDQQQWHIFSTLFGGESAHLYLIGDPKQAIYKFRGADIFSYFDAQQRAQRHYTLTRNWRSQPPLVAAVNALFGRHRRPFWFEQLHFIPVQAGVTATKPQLLPPLLLCQLAPSGTRDGYWSAGKARQALQQAVVQEILRLCGQSRTVAADVPGSSHSNPVAGEEGLMAHDIAVLVRTNQAARDYQLALQAVGMPAVLHSVESVFSTQEALDLHCLLQALAYPGDLALLKQALTLPWFSLDGQALHRLGNNDTDIDHWQQRFQHYHQLWQRSGFMAMMLAVLHAENISAQTARQINAERRLINIQHLLELVQQACLDEHLGILKTLDWLRAAITEAATEAGDAQQLRLESDAHAVQIVTLHRSKGLEYPVVFCPDLWQHADNQEKDTLVVCHENGKRVADLGSERFAARREQALQEALAEDLRIVYVALTRAKYRCYLSWADVRGKDRANGSALAYLLFTAGGDGWRDALRDFDFSAQQQHLQHWCKQAPEMQYQLIEPQTSEIPQYPHRIQRTGAPIAARGITRSLHSNWQMSSYTALAALSRDDTPELPEDKAQETASGALTRIAAQLPLAMTDDDAEAVLPAAALPPGAQTGNVVHELLETLDFQTLAAGTGNGVARQQACWRYGLTLAQPQQLDALLQTVVRAPLSASDPEFCLANIPAHRCVKEMPFYLSMPPLGTAAINRILQDCPDFQALQPQQLEGFLTGFIDLVCAYKGRYYLLDYKTNILANYENAHLTAAMQAHNYGLQYWIYTLVLDRYLQKRVPGYSYPQHFGGVLYLFVRGMAPSLPAHGVYSAYPDAARLQALRQLFQQEKSPF